MSENVLPNPSAQEAWRAVLRSLTKTEAKGLRKQIVSDFTRVELKTQSGLYIGSRPGYNVDMDRIRKVLKRIVRGLYFKETGNPLGLETEIRIYLDDDYIKLTSEARATLEPIMSFLGSLPPKSIGQNIFLYRYHIIEQDPLISTWGLSFYGSFPFLVMTGPSNHKITLLKK